MHIVMCWLCASLTGPYKEDARACPTAEVSGLLQAREFTSRHAPTETEAQVDENGGVIDKFGRMITP